MSKIVFLLAALLLGINTGCNTQTTPYLDTGSDSSKEIDGQTEISDGFGKDGETDSTSDIEMGVDSSWLPVHTITFAHGENPFLLTLAEIKTDGSDYKMIPNFGIVSLAFENEIVGGLREYLQFSRDIPQRERHIEYSPIYLPRGLGYIRLYQDLTLGKVGILLARPDGQLSSLYSVSGSSAEDLQPYFAVSRDGKLVAAIRKGNGVVLMSTDGTKFANGKTFVDFFLNPTPGYFSRYSLTFVGKNLFFVTRIGDHGTQNTLWRVPVDGSDVPKPVLLPKVSGSDPGEIGSTIVTSEDGNFAATLAGSYLGIYDVIVVDENGSATNLTNDSGYYDTGRDLWGYSGGLSPMIAFSPSGKYIAYVKKPLLNVSSLYIRNTDGTGTPIEITNKEHFVSTPRVLDNLRFIDDNILIFVAGISDGRQDIYYYDVSSQTPYNVTGYGSTTKPFDLNGSITLRGMWFSPNKQYLYFVEVLNSGSQINIKAIDLTTWTIKDISHGAQLFVESDGVKTCTNDSKMYFATSPNAQTKTNYEIFYFDMDTASPATKLASLSSLPLGSTGTFHDMMTSPDCEFYAFTAGAQEGYLDIYVGKSTSPLALRQITNESNMGLTLTNIILDHSLISSDNEIVAFASGRDSLHFGLKISPIKEIGMPKTIFTGTPDPSAYWILFGIR